MRLKLLGLPNGQPSILHPHLQLSIIILKRRDLLHDVVEVFLQVSWGTLDSLDRLLVLLLFQTECLGRPQGVPKRVCQLVIDLDDVIFGDASFYPALAVRDLVAWIERHAIRVTVPLAWGRTARATTLLLGRRSDPWIREVAYVRLETVPIIKRCIDTGSFLLFSYGIVQTHSVFHLVRVFVGVRIAVDVVDVGRHQVKRVLGGRRILTSEDPASQVENWLTTETN